MKKYIKNGILLIFLILLLVLKNYIFSLFIPGEIEISNEYIKYLEKENTNLSEILNIKYENINFAYGKVLYQNPYKFGQTINISIDTTNINENDLVITSKGLIGKIKYVYKNFAIVSLIGSNDFVLNVKVNDYYGILKSDNNIVYIDSINNYNNLNIGDIIYSSNLNNNIPIKIGTIKNKIIDKNNISNNYEIELFDNLNDLNYVYVIGVK